MESKICAVCKQRNNPAFTHCWKCKTEIKTVTVPVERLNIKRDSPLNEALGALMNASLVPIALLNILGGLAGGIWLLVLGEWRAVLAGFIVCFMFPWLYTFLGMIPITIFAMPAFRLNEKKDKNLALTLLFLNSFTTHVFGLLWGGIIIFYSIAYSTESKHFILPYFMFGWSVAIGPFQFMLSKELPNSMGSSAALYLYQLSYLIMAVFFFLGVLGFAPVLIFLMTVGLNVCLISAIADTYPFLKKGDTIQH